jgi:hypothetical protein
MNQELAVIPDQALVPANPSELLRIAVTQGADIDKLEKLMELQLRWDANEARRSFTEAMTRFKSESIVIIKDKTNAQYNSKYPSIGNLVNTVTPFLSKHGLSASWDVEQSGTAIKVTCILRHSQGHSESVSMTVPPDTSGQKNPLQQIKSAITYAKVCTFESACGVASVDANLDDDGNASGMSMGDLSEKLEWIENCASLDELHKQFTSAYRDAKKLNDSVAMKSLISAKDKRKRELQ